MSALVWLPRPLRCTTGCSPVGRRTDGSRSAQLREPQTDDLCKRPSLRGKRAAVAVAVAFAVAVAAASTNAAVDDDDDDVLTLRCALELLAETPVRRDRDGRLRKRRDLAGRQEGSRSGAVAAVRP